MKLTFILCCLLLASCSTLRGTGDLGLVVEREKGNLLIVENSSDEVLKRIEGLGDLSHASIVYSKDARFAFVFGRDGGLTRVDLLGQKITHRVIQAGNSIGGAISQDGKIVAVSNYKPGGVKLFNSENLELLKEIPAYYDGGKRSKVIGLVDAPKNKFVFSLFDSGETWVLDAKTYEIKKFKNIGKLPYDALITSNGRYYVAGLFGEDGVSVLDLWNKSEGPRKKLRNYGKGKQKLPVYKMPHLEGWAQADEYIFLPAVGQHQLLVVRMKDWKIIKRIKVKSQVIFAMSQPDQKQIWVNFALPHNQYLQVIDTKTLKIQKTFELGKGVLHMEFTPRGEKVWVSVRDENKVAVIDTQDLKVLKVLPADRPSGIFFTSRAHKIGL